MARQNSTEISRFQYIDARIRSGTYPNSSALATEYEVTKRTIERDIEKMKDMMNAPIAYSQDFKGYYYTDKNFSISMMLLTEGDLFHLSIAQRLLEQYRATPAFPAMEKVFSKITEMLPDKIDLDSRWLDAKFDVFSEPQCMINEEDWKTVFEGLMNNQTISFFYKALGSSELTWRELDPYHAICHKGLWYIIGMCHKRQKVQIFLISRMKNPQLTKERFELPSNFDPYKHIDPHRGIYFSDQEYNVKIQFYGLSAEYARERNWGKDQNIKELDDGSIILSFTTNQLKETSRWILSQGQNALALAPQELCATIKEELSGALNRYP